VVAAGVSNEELEKARNLRVAAFWRELQTINGKASALGSFEVFTGDHENLFAIPEQLAAVSPSDLQAVAATALKRSNATIGVLRPPSAGGDE
jgi:zinc protease